MIFVNKGKQPTNLADKEYNNKNVKDELKII